ncbi:MAG: exonuclease SbcCD subunit D [Chloroflexi bacterium]|nr:exonuclease SbcCD subunit D [Chloroflexota bacterium]
MAFRFLHLADVHLGYCQYGSDIRYDDFALALQRAVQYAVAQQVDFVLLAGDLFHKHSIDPKTLYQATALLAPLRERNIPILAVIGNHDKPRIDEDMSWLDYLSATGQIVLLDAQVGEKAIKVAPWDESIRRGTYIDLPCGARIVGMRYYGASTAQVLESYAQALRALPPAPYTILMLHAGLQGVMDYETPSISRSQLNLFTNYADYIALGHFHKPFDQDDWIYNPGSLETVGVDECAWEDRGYLLVEVDPTRHPKHKVSRFISPRRPFVRVRLTADTMLSPAELSQALMTLLQRSALPTCKQEPVLEITIGGKLQFDHSELDPDALTALVQEAFHPLLVRVQDATSIDDADLDLPETLTRIELERQVLSELIRRDARFRNAEAAWGGFVTHIKEAALTNTPPEDIANDLKTFLAEHPWEPANAD